MSVSLSDQRLARITGVLFLITYATSIPALLLFDGTVLDDPGYIVGAGDDGLVRLGASLEVILIIANIGTALALYPVLKRHSKALSLGFLSARVMESVFIAVGILSLLAVVTLRQEGGDAGSLVPVGEALVAIKDWTFLLGPGLTVGVGNGLILGYLMYRTGLVPRGMAMLGLIGGPLIVLSGLGVLFDLYDLGEAPQMIATIPEFFWELSLGIYLTVKGFKPVLDPAE